MNDVVILGLAGAAGVFLGAIFFGGLWLSLRRALSSQRPALWLLGGFALRTSISLAGFYFVSGGHWDRMLMCLLGFVIARMISTRFSAPPVGPGSSPAKEAGHAP